MGWGEEHFLSSYFPDKVNPVFIRSYQEIVTRYRHCRHNMILQWIRLCILFSLHSENVKRTNSSFLKQHLLIKTVLKHISLIESNINVDKNLVFTLIIISHNFIFFSDIKPRFHWKVSFWFAYLKPSVPQDTSGT